MEIVNPGTRVGAFAKSAEGFEGKTMARSAAGKARRAAGNAEAKAKAKAERTRKREAEASPYARTAAGFPTGSSSANQTAGIGAATDELGMDAALEPVLPEAAATMRRQLFVARREERRVEGGGLCFYAAVKTMLETEVAGGSAMFDSPRGP